MARRRCTFDYDRVVRVTCPHPLISFAEWQQALVDLESIGIIRIVLAPSNVVRHACVVVNADGIT